MSSEAVTTADSRPRVAVFAARFLPYSQTFIYDQVRHHQRYRAHVVTRVRLNADRFPFDEVTALTPGRGWPRRWSSQLEAALYAATFFSPTINRLIRDGRFALLHGHFGSASCYALPYASRFNLPLVVTFHGYDVASLQSPKRRRPVNWPYWALSTWLFRRADLLLPVSEDLARILESLGAPPDRIRVHPLGVETNVGPRRDRGDNAFVVVMVGRFVEKKGFEYGIRGFASVAQSHPEARLIVIGDGPLGPALRRLIRDLGMEHRVELRPPAAHADVIDVMRSADVALVPSVTARDGDREGMTMIVKEAGAMGLPVVASRHAGIPEAVNHDVTGLLVDERDADGIAAALNRLLTNAGERRRLGDAGRARIRRDFDLETQIGRLEQLYDEAIARHDHR